MKIMDIFRPSQPATPEPSVNPEPSANPSVDVSPMEAFKDIWQNGDSDTDVDDADFSSLFNIDPEKIQETVSNFDFTQSLDPAALDAISAGGEEAQKAFAASLNTVAKDVFSKAMLANGMLVKQALEKAQDKIDTRTSRNYQRLKASEELTSSNPLFKDPAVAPMIGAIQAQLHRKYPDASSSEIKQQAERYLLQFADVIRGPSTKDKDITPTDSDFSNFLDF